MSTEVVASKLGPLSGNLHTHVLNLGVIFDSALTFDKQMLWSEVAFIS